MFLLWKPQMYGIQDFEFWDYEVKKLKSKQFLKSWLYFKILTLQYQKFLIFKNMKMFNF